MLTASDYETSRQALAFVRAFNEGDAAGAQAMLASLPVDQFPGFVSTMATMVREAVSIGELSPSAFFAAFGALLDTNQDEL